MVSVVLDKEKEFYNEKKVIECIIDNNYDIINSATTGIG